ncbi:MAG: hypothetical protein ACFKPT_08860 [Gloeotrichia echinulata GP01]
MTLESPGFIRGECQESKYLKIAVSVPIGGNLNVAKEIIRGVAGDQDEVNGSDGINGNLLDVAMAQPASGIASLEF